MISFEWPQQYLDKQREVIEFAEKELNPHIPLDKSKFPRDLWQACADYGVQSLMIPTQYTSKGSEVDFLQSILIMEGLGYACVDNGLTFGLNAQMWTVQTPLLHFGSDYIKEKYLSALCSGEMIGAHCLTEPEAGSDVFSMQCSAIKTDGGYILNGEKCLITLAPECDIALIFAVTNANMGTWGLSVFVVESASEGFIAHKRQGKMGLNSIPIGSISLKDCFVPDANLLGSEGLGYSIINHSLEYDRCTILASHLGAMERQIEENIDFVKKRFQYKKSIGSFQSVSNRIADMKLRLETSRLLLYKSAWLKQNNKSNTLEVAMLKLHLSEAFVQSSIDSMRNHGGYGYLSENGIEEYLRDAMGGVIYAGTSDIQRNIISKMLGL